MLSDLSIRKARQGKLANAHPNCFAQVMPRPSSNSGRSGAVRHSRQSSREERALPAASAIQQGLPQRHQGAAEDGAEAGDIYEDNVEGSSMTGQKRHQSKPAIEGFVVSSRKARPVPLSVADGSTSRRGLAASKCVLGASVCWGGVVYIGFLVFLQSPYCCLPSPTLSHTTGPWVPAVGGEPRSTVRWRPLQLQQ